jgi:hypothetical protein
MNAPQYWQWRNECSAILASARWYQREYTGGYTKRMGNLSSDFDKIDKYSSAVYPYGAMIAK